MTDSSPNICFIGGGNMARSLIGGLIDSGVAPDRITACDIHADTLENLAADFSIHTNQDSKTAAAADIVVLAVKPQILQAVCRELANAEFRQGVLFISIAAGIRETEINAWLGGERAIVRCMPNTPALVGQGATGLYANPQVNDEQRNAADGILAAVGVTVWVDNEGQLDAVTAISGSGPAYFFLFIEALQNAAVALDLPPETAKQLAQQTALGAATMAQGKDVAELRAQVTSKGGTTEQAIARFQADGLETLVKAATQAANDRSVELADILAK